MTDSRKVLPLRPRQNGASRANSSPNAPRNTRNTRNNGNTRNARRAVGNGRAGFGVNLRGNSGGNRRRSQLRNAIVRLSGNTVGERLGGNNWQSKSQNNSQFFSAGRSRFNIPLLGVGIASPLENRLTLVWLVMLIFMVILGIRLYYLQVLDTKTLAALAKSQQQVELRLFMPRRSIVDHQGNVLAIDRPAYTLFAHPKLFDRPPQELAKKLAPLVHQKSTELLGLFQQQESGILLTNFLREEEAQQIKSLHANGLELLPHHSRLYPQGDLAAEILGYVDLEHQGQAGLEFHQRQLIEGRSRPLLARQNAQGGVLPDQVDIGALRFDDRRLALTIDSRLQRAARTALKTSLGKFGAKRGAVVVMDVRDGSIPALVVEPTFDANTYFKFPVENFKNWAIADTYEPGSTFKPLNVAIALDAGAIQPTDIFNDPGKLYFGEDMIQNADRSGRGDMNLTDILAYSSNIGMVKIIQAMKPTVYYQWLEKIGLGKSTGVDLPFEAPSSLRNQQDFITKPIELATASFGQGFALTPLQLTQMMGSLANGGKLVTPHVIKGLADDQGQMDWQATYPEPQQIFTPNTTKLVLEMMEKVVENGTGKPAQIPGYRIAGKTGTAQKALPGSGYTRGAIVASFVGIIPANDPRYVVLGVVDEPRGGTFGSTAAAPMVREVMEALISVKQIPPS